jgi:pimeloyl-ACP methyl ester carboxylesterase
MVFLPAMLCNDELYHLQIEAGTDGYDYLRGRASRSRGCEHFRRMARLAGPGAFLRQNTALLGRLDRPADLARVACPTLLVWGREDRFAAVRHGAEMGALIPAARLVVLDGCGHLPTLERPDATIALAREWLGQLGVKARACRRRYDFQAGGSIVPWSYPMCRRVVVGLGLPYWCLLASYLN